MYWVLQTVLRTIDRASEEGKLFTFVPDFYVDVCINTITALTSYFHPTVPYTSLPGKYHLSFPLLPPAIRRMGEGNSFSLFTFRGGRGVPGLRFSGGSPVSDFGGVPSLRFLGGVPVSDFWGRGVPVSDFQGGGTQSQ